MGLRVTGRLEIPFDEIEIKAVRSSGSGGQHVNKVSTAIHLFFDIHASSLPIRVKSSLLEKRDHRITEAGVVVIKCQDSRSQEANRETALERLAELVKSACVVPKKRRPTKPTKGSKERRLQSKAKRGKTKNLRGRFGSSDW